MKKIHIYALVWFKSFKNSRIEDVFEMNLDDISQKNKKLAFCIGFGDWKQKYIRQYLPQYKLAFIDHRIPSFRVITIIKQVERDYDVFIWSYKEDQKLLKYFNQERKCIIRVEDGFIRSVGLGVDETQPLSLIFDHYNLYFNKNSESGLEKIIFEKSATYSNIELKYARTLIKKIIKNKLTKYNFQNTSKIDNDLCTSTKKKILVIGQVENDMSIQKGCNFTCTNLDILKTAKKENPNAIIIFKPHPDILSGKRKNHSDTKLYLKSCDILATNGSVLDYITIVDHVYTITSLSGFEALIRGKKVTCFGSPFYAHWGLTDDRSPPVSRRNGKMLNIESLFYSAYIEYPTYLYGNIDETIKRIIYETKKQNTKNI